VQMELLYLVTFFQMEHNGFNWMTQQAQLR